MGDFKQLKAWQEAMDLVEHVYREFERFPAAERFGLQSQLRRAVVSIAANIAEGTGKGSDRELIRYLRIARGSASEVECLCHVAGWLTFPATAVAAALVAKTQSVSRMILALQRGLGP
jgi:four helix bundle protein